MTNLGRTFDGAVELEHRLSSPVKPHQDEALCGTSVRRQRKDLWSVRPERADEPLSGQGQRRPFRHKLSTRIKLHRRSREPPGLPRRWQRQSSMGPDCPSREPPAASRARLSICPATLVPAPGAGYVRDVTLVGASSKKGAAVDLAELFVPIYRLKWLSEGKDSSVASNRRELTVKPGSEARRPGLKPWPVLRRLSGDHLPWFPLLFMEIPKFSSRLSASSFSSSFP